MTRAIPLIALLALAACAEEPAGFDGSYRLLTIDGAAIPGTASLTVEGAAVTGQGPCNRFMTSNSAAWPQMALAPIATTRMMCVSEGGEALFLAALAQVTRAAPVKGGLELSGPRHRLRFAAD